MTLNVAIYGASGYTGAELIRLLTLHPDVKVTALSAESNAGRAMADVFPQLSALDLPTLTTIADLDLAPVDVLFCALPHGTTQTSLKAAMDAKPDLKVVDLSADFRLADPAMYAHWYGHAHQAEALQTEAVYGLTEIHRERGRQAHGWSATRAATPRPRCSRWSRWSARAWWTRTTSSSTPSPG